MSNPTTTKPSSRRDQVHWFMEEVQPHHSQLKSYLRGSFPSIRDVDDVVQESYVRVWKTRHILRPRARSFLYTVARNLAIDMLRREAISPVENVPDMENLEVAASQPSPDEAACTRDELDLLLAAIESLPARCREVVVLRKIHSLSPPEIARRMGISEGTVHLHGAKGVRRCEEFLRQHGVKFD